MTFEAVSPYSGCAYVEILDRPLAASRAILQAMSAGYEVVDVTSQERVQGPTGKTGAWKIDMQLRTERQRR